MKRYIPTGNELVSLPTVCEENGGVECISFLSMSQKGMIELRGNGKIPLIQPFFELTEESGFKHPLDLKNGIWTREGDWIPAMKAESEGARISVQYLSPVGERGFGIRMTAASRTTGRICFGLKGLWHGAWHCINEDKKIEGSMHCYRSEWNDNLVFDFRTGFSLFAFAPMSDHKIKCSSVQNEEGISYLLSYESDLQAEKTETLTVWWGIGFEEVAAATSAKEMLRRTWEWEYNRTLAWLEKHRKEMPTEKLTRLYNTNLFFCMFYSTGITLDTEELVCVTSRSSRYYVSAAYWDRDTLLWSFPAILDADQKLAKKILLYIFRKQCRNFGVHSRYIDGTVLEPGFELDELVAPIIALSAYVTSTKDEELLSDKDILEGIYMILEKLNDMKHPEVDLYETFLQPTDDERLFPYLTFDNVLVWVALSRLSKIDPPHFGNCAEKAERVRQAILHHCVFKDSYGKPYFGWSTDLSGNHDIYDEPPGSLQLLPYYGFCCEKDEIWQSTVNMIRSPDYLYSFAGKPIAEIGCPHAPFPWVLSICNSLLAGYEEQAWKELEMVEMDNGVACESIDPEKGTCMTGAAFATCAGFLCHSMFVARGCRSAK